MISFEFGSVCAYACNDWGRSEARAQNMGSVCASAIRAPTLPNTLMNMGIQNRVRVDMVSTEGRRLKILASNSRPCLTRVNTKHYNKDNGVIAQLVEWLVYTEFVGGSIPSNPKIFSLQYSLCCNRRRVYGQSRTARIESGHGRSPLPYRRLHGLVRFAKLLRPCPHYSNSIPNYANSIPYCPTAKKNDILGPSSKG